MQLEAKKILVTGADGFIGSHLVERLVERGYSVKAFVYYNSFNSCGWLDSLPAKIISEVEIFSGDVRDPHGVATAVKGCESVLHLAALIGIPYSYHSPDSYVDTNIRGTLNILNACRDAGIGRLLVTSTSEVYGTAQFVPMTEEHPLQGQSPYSATKIGADQLALSFYRSFNLPVTVVRPFNTYGPRQSARAVIPTIITQVLSGKRELKIGALHPTRDFVYVTDTADGFIEILKARGTCGEVLNLSTRKEISIGDLVNKIAKLCNVAIHTSTERQRLRPKKSEVERLLGDNAKVLRLTRWKPRYSIEDGLKETIQWFSDKGNLSRYKPMQYNV